MRNKADKVNKAVQADKKSSRVDEGVQQILAGDRFLTINEACALLGLKRTSFWQYRKDGKLPQGTRFSGNRRRWLKSELLQAVAAFEG